jgi:excisionase family DNA binding protein
VNPPARIAYSIAEAAEMIGVSRTTLYQLISDGLLPIRKLGKRSLIKREDLETLITKGTPQCKTPAMKVAARSPEAA